MDLRRQHSLRHQGMQPQRAPFSWFSLLWSEGGSHVDPSVWLPLGVVRRGSTQLSSWMRCRDPGPHHPTSFLEPTCVFSQNPWEPLRTKGNRAISNLPTQQRLAERELNWGRGGGGWKHETLFPKILCVFPPIPETELWGLSSSRKPAHSTSRWLEMLLLTSVFSPAPGCRSVPSLHLQGWLSWSCGGCCFSASSPRIPRTADRLVESWPDTRGWWLGAAQLSSSEFQFWKNLRSQAWGAPVSLFFSFLPGLRLPLSSGM